MRLVFTIAIVALLAIKSAAEKPAAPDNSPKPSVKSDINGDPLPEGAVARIGRARLRCWKMLPPSCSHRPLTPCAWLCIHPGWLRGSSISRNGAPTSYGASIIRSSPARMPGWPNSPMKRAATQELPSPAR